MQLLNTHSSELNNNNARTLLYKLQPRIEISDSNEVQVQFNGEMFFSIKAHNRQFITADSRDSLIFEYAKTIILFNYDCVKLSRLVNAHEPSPAFDINFISS